MIGSSCFSIANATVKLVFFASPLFRDRGDVGKITGREYSKFHAILVHYLVQQAKTRN